MQSGLLLLPFLPVECAQRQHHKRDFHNVVFHPHDSSQHGIRYSATIRNRQWRQSGIDNGDNQDQFLDVAAKRIISRFLINCKSFFTNVDYSN